MEHRHRTGERVIFHIDVNSAFLSWSAVERLKEDPSALDLRTVPSVVAGDVKTRHGIITAKSIPAKKYGIRTAMPVAQALRQCPDLILVQADFQVYRRYSHAFLDILHEHSPLVEQASIDEAYMDMTGLEKAWADLEEAGEPFPLCAARAIKDQIRQQLGFTVNVGISVNKLLAKMASDFEKPDKIHTLYPEEVAEKMWPLPIGDLHGCGRATASRLQAIGIRTIGDAAAADLSVLQSYLGEKAGLYIWNSANGRSSSPVQAVRQQAKSVSNETTTPFDITSTNFEREALPIVRRLSASVARRLKKDGFFGKTVQVSVKTADFARRSRQTGLETSTNDEEVIYRTACRLLRELSFGGRGLLTLGGGYRLIGVGVTNLDRGQYRQLSLADLAQYQEELEAEQKEKEKQEQALRKKKEREEQALRRKKEQEEKARREKKEREDRLSRLDTVLQQRFGSSVVTRGHIPGQENKGVK